MVKSGLECCKRLAPPSLPPRISGRPFLGFPITTTFAFALLARFSVPSMPFHSKSCGADALGHNLLEVPDASRFDAFAFCLLLLLL
jgi:hypothetical protein